MDNDSELIASNSRLPSSSEELSYHKFVEKIYSRQYENASHHFNKNDSEQFLNDFFSIFFAGFFSEKNYRSIAMIEDAIEIFLLKTKQIILPYLNDVSQKESTLLFSADSIVAKIRLQLPMIYQMVWSDAEAAFAGDPAAESIKEVILAYSGFYSICVHRISHLLYTFGVPIFPRILSRYAHEKTGIDIHPGAQIGSHFFMDHGTGIVIGGTTIIGNNVKIYQGVTLGALSVSKDLAQIKRHPTIEDNVIVYAGATILGGKTVIGKSSIIGGNAWITHSIPAFSIVYQTNEIKVRSSHISGEDQNDFII